MLEATALGHRYPGGDWLFRNLDLRVDPGLVVTVLGPNARGKTTLLTCLAGLRSAREGQVRQSGGIGYVPQSHATAHQYSVREIVVMGRIRRIRAWATPSSEDYDAAMASLDRVGMADRAEHPYLSLSGGQRQLVLTARALVHEPRTLILDEPTSALDLRNQRRVLTVITELADQGMGIVLTTHDPTHALHVSTHTLVMDELLRFGPTARLLTGELLSALYHTPVHTTEIAFDSGPRTVVVPAPPTPSRTGLDRRR